jgi:putative PIN family toxin of toxin-antitoxin system
MTPLRIVLDSNVVISGFLFGGPPSQLLQHLVAGAAQSFTSVPILDEIRDVLQRPKFGLSPEQAIKFAEVFHELCRIVSPDESVLAIPADPDDNAVLECALAAGAKVVVSGDSHLLDLREWKGIRILSPSEAVAEIERESDIEESATT